MYAVKFEADVKDGVIRIPNEYLELESKHLEIVALVINNVLPSQNESEPKYDNEYIERNWEELASKALVNFDADTDGWKYEYGEYLVEKNR